MFKKEIISKILIILTLLLALPPLMQHMHSKQQMVELKLQLPQVKQIGTPKNLRSPNLEKHPIKVEDRPDLMVPVGTKLLSKGKPVTSSDMEPIIGEIDMITDGDKEAVEGSYVELGPMKQWVQIDLKKKSTIYAVVIWHYHSTGRVYYDVVVQSADDPDFIKNVKTIYNNDHDNSSGLGVGKDKEYIENHGGRLINAKGVKGRFVRLYSNGSTASEMNHYIEVEVYGK